MDGGTFTMEASGEGHSPGVFRRCGAGKGRENPEKLRTQNQQASRGGDEKRGFKRKSVESPRKELPAQRSFPPPSPPLKHRAWTSS